MGMTLPKGSCPLCLSRMDPATRRCVSCGTSMAAAKDLLRKERAAKYSNRKTRSFAPGEEMLVFDSRKEARRWQELRLLQQSGAITLLSRQERFRLVVNGRLVCAYVADFTYIDAATGRFVIEDAKGVRTRRYRIKKKLFEALTGYAITEV